MRHFLVSAVLCVMLFANLTADGGSGGGGSIVPIPDGYEEVCGADFDARFRNVPAVDTECTGLHKIYMSSFGLGDATGDCEPISVVDPFLLQFSWSYNAMANSMSIVNLRGIVFNDIFVNAQNDDIMEPGYDLIRYTDGERDYLLGDNLENDISPQYPHYARVHSGSGFWASPVVVHTPGAPTQILLLNKSGLLMSVGTNFSDPETVNWALDLRQFAVADMLPEDSCWMEFMATPTVAGNNIYVAGLHSIFRLNMQGELSEHFHFSNMPADDQFIAPLAVDENGGGGEILIAQSFRGGIVEFDGFNNPSLTYELSSSRYAKPLVDGSGFNFFPGSQNKYRNQSIRLLGSVGSPYLSGGSALTEMITDNFTAVCLQHGSPSAMPAIFHYNNTGDEIPVFYKQSFASDENTCNVTFDDVKIHALGVPRYILLNNHGFMFDEIGGNSSVYSHISNQVPATFFNDDFEREIGWYNNYNPADFCETALEMRRILHMNLAIPNDGEAGIVWENQVNFGGPNAYLTNENYRDIAWGSEDGRIWTHKKAFPYQLVGLEIDEVTDDRLVSQYGNPVFMQDVSHVPDQPRVNLQVEIVDIDEDLQIEAVSVNGYYRTVDDGPQTEVTVQFDNILQHPNCTVIVVPEYGDPLEYTCQDNSGGFIRLSFEHTREIFNGQTFTIDNNTAVPAVVIVHAGGELEVTGNVEHSLLKIVLQRGGKINIGEEARLRVRYLDIKNDANLTGCDANINIHGYGHCYVNTMDFFSEADRRASTCVLKGARNQNFIVEDCSIWTNEENAVFTIDTPFSPCGDSYTALLRNVVLNSYLYTNDNVRMSHFDADPTPSCSTCEWIINGQSEATIQGYAVPNSQSMSHAKIEVRGGSSLNLTQTDFILTCYQNPCIHVHEDAALNLYGGEEPVNATNLIVENGELILDTNSSMHLHDNSNVRISTHSDPGYTTGSLVLGDDVTITSEVPGDDIACSTVSIDYGANLVPDPDGNDIVEGMDIYATGYTPATASTQDICFDFHLSNEQATYVFEECDIANVLIFEIDGEYSSFVFDHCKFAKDHKGILAQRSESSAGTFTFSNCSFTENDHAVNLRGVPATFTACKFGDPVLQTDGNGIAVIANKSPGARFDNCDFADNHNGIYALESVIEVGGYLDEDLPPNNQIVPLGACTFTQNQLPIYANFDSPFPNQSVICGNTIEDNSLDGLMLLNTNFHIVNNDISDNGRNGVFGDDSGFLEISGNTIEDNGGAEFVGPRPCYDNISNGNNTISESNAYVYVVRPEKEPMFNAEYMNQFILYYDREDPSVQVDVSGNAIPHEDHRRFYPEYEAFIFGDESSEEEEAYRAGVDNYKSSDYAAARTSFVSVVTLYPETGYASTSLAYLLFIENRTDHDYAGYRDYLATVADSQYVHLAETKEMLITQSYIYEKEYAVAIDRLEEVIDAPATEMDSIMALIDQGYCYLKMAEEGEVRCLPNCTVETGTEEEYVQFVSDLLNPGAEDAGEAPEFTFALGSNYPNPFNPTTTIRFSIPQDGKVELSVYNVRGQLVKRLLNEPLEAGRHDVVWNGRNNSDRPVSSGVYFYRLKSGGRTQVRKMLLLK